MLNCLNIFKNKLRIISSLLPIKSFSNLSSGTYSGIKGNTTNSTDTDEEYNINTDMKRKNKKNTQKIKIENNTAFKYVELNDVSLLKSINFQKYFPNKEVEEEDKDLDEEYDFSAKSELFRNIDLIVGIEDKFKMILEVYENGILMTVNLNKFREFISEEVIKAYVPTYLKKGNPNKILSLDEIKHLLLYLTNMMAHTNYYNLKQYDYLIKNYLADYMKKLVKDENEKMNFKEFLFLIKFNTNLKFEQLDYFLLAGLQSMFADPFTETSYKEFINNNPEYKHLLKCLPIIITYIARVEYTKQINNKIVINNIIDSIINLKKVLKYDIVLFDNMSNACIHLGLYFKDHILNWAPLVFLFEEEFLNINIELLIDFNSFVKFTIGFLSLLDDRLYLNLNYEAIFLKILNYLEFSTKNEFKDNIMLKLIKSYYGFVMIKLNKDYSLNEKIEEYNSKILAHLYNKYIITERRRPNIHIDSKVVDKNSLLLITFMLRTLFRVTVPKSNVDLHSNIIIHLDNSFIKGVETMEVKSLIYFFQRSIKDFTKTDSDFIISTIYKRINNLKNENFHTLSNNLAILFKLNEKDKENIQLTFKSDFLNKLYYESITGNLFIYSITLQNLVSNLINFSHLNVIKEGKIHNKKNLPISLDEAKIITTTEITDIQKGIRTPIESDISDIIEHIFQFVLVSDKKYLALKLGFIQELVILSYNSNKREYLFKKYFVSVIYPFLIIFFRSITTRKDAIILFKYLSDFTTRFCYLNDGCEMMTCIMKLMAKSLNLASKLDETNQKEEDDLLLATLNQFYKKYSFNPAHYEQVHKAHRRHQFLKYILRKRFILGRKINGNGPVVIEKIKNKNVIEKTTDLTDNFFFG